MKSWNFLPAILSLFLFVDCTATHSNHSKPTPSNPIGMKKKSIEKASGIREVVQVGCTDHITLTRGQILILKLPATAGTGYMWLLPQPVSALKLQEENVLKYEKVGKPENGKVGFPQHQVLTLEAVEAGEVTLNWVYVRPTDPQNVGGTCAMRVTIQE